MGEYRDSGKDMYILFILIFQKYYYKNVQIKKSHTQINQMQCIYLVTFHTIRGAVLKGSRATSY